MSLEKLGFFMGLMGLVFALLIANEFLEREMEERVSRGYIRGVKHGRFNTYSG